VLDSERPDAVEIGKSSPNAFHCGRQNGIERRTTLGGTESDQHLCIGLAIRSRRSDYRVDLDLGEQLVSTVRPHHPKPRVLKGFAGHAVPPRNL
jgi:hypothetical protein